MDIPHADRGRITLVVGAVMVATWAVVALAAPWLAPYDPAAIDYVAMLQPPSAAHWFGTDHLGRDILSRVLVGARTVALIAPAATLLGLVLGTLLGLSAAYAGGWIDEALMRVLDAAMALPLIVLALLALTLLGPSPLNVVLVIGFVFAPLVARTVRAAARGEAGKDYVAAARMRGERVGYILLFELLPNVRGPLAVEGTLRVGYAVFTAATLGFLGLGLQPPTPDWGLMVGEYQPYLVPAPWTVLFPAGAIAFVVVGIGLFADGLKEVLRA